MSRLHSCAVCGTEYDARQQAADCERRCDGAEVNWRLDNLFDHERRSDGT